MVLVREFRVPLPLSVEEYRVGQLYSVAKSSSQQTNGGEGVEVLKNEPYKSEKEEGQYTEKIYHLGASLPGWIRAIIPSSALKLEERAWNAYPYCKTVITSPFLGEKFTFTIESRHAADDGTQPNPHGLDEKQLKAREMVDVIDIGIDKVEEKDYKKEEDPSLVRSEKASRGPLAEGWIKSSNPIMCCYKLVTVEFKVFGMQSKVERYMMDMERNIFLKFHRQVYSWLDEWYGWTMDDVRKYEDQTKKDLENKLKGGANGNGNGESSSSSSSSTSTTISASPSTAPS